MPEQLVVIGNGMAPGRVLEQLTDHPEHGYEITVFNAEPRVNYDRIMLSPVLSGERGYEDIIIHDDDWYSDRSITLHKGKPVIDINRDTRTVRAVDGTTARYDKLLIATGSQPFMPPIPGKELEGVLSYRDLDDVEAMLAAAADGRRAVVIGGGLLGLEAAAGLNARGMDVTVLHLGPTLMERQLDVSAGCLLREALLKRGIEVVTEANTEEIIGADAVEAVRLADGRFLPADIVVIAVGITPNVSLASAAGLEVRRGIVVGDDMRSSDPDILAVGECVEHRGSCYGLVAPLYDMAKVVTAQLLGMKDRYTGSTVSTKLKVTGLDVYSAGDFAGGAQREDIVLRDAARQVYKRLTIEDNRIVGIVLFGDTRDGPWFNQQLRERADISDIREMLIFGQNYAGGTKLDPTAAVAALPDDSATRSCNGLNQSETTTAADAEGLISVMAIRAAAAGCAGREVRRGPAVEAHQDTGERQ